MILFGKHRDGRGDGFGNYRLYRNLRADPGVLDVLAVWEDITDEAGAVIDSRLAEVMPVFRSDTLESLFMRYTRVFPGEVMALDAEMKAERAVMRERGWSAGRSMRLAMKLPEKLYRCIEMLIPGFFGPANIRAGMKRLRELVPDLAVGRV